MLILFSSCCDGCVPPKRTSDCHCTCKEYKDAKAEHEARLEAERKKIKGEVDAYAVLKKGKEKVSKKTHDRMNCKWRK